MLSFSFASCMWMGSPQILAVLHDSANPVYVTDCAIEKIEVIVGKIE